MSETTEKLALIGSLKLPMPESNLKNYIRLFNVFLALVSNELRQGPLSGDVFIFIGKRSNQIRLLQWDIDGYGLYCKRLEQGTFQWPSGAHKQISDQDLLLILRGIQPRWRTTRISEAT